jgi:hypothetical protein
LLFVTFASALPLLDLVFGVIRRTRASRSPFFGDRAHWCDLLLRRAWSPRGVALACYAVSAAFAMGWIALRTRISEFAVISTLALAALVGASWRLGALTA